MNNMVTELNAPDIELQRLVRLLPRQKQAYLKNAMPTAKQRRQKLQQLKQAIVAYQQELTQAISEDFSNRSRHETQIAEIMTSLEGIKYMMRHLSGWMKPSKRHIDLLFAPGSNRVEYQPLGVVGIMVPWNYPIQLALVPLATALAAGNRAMLKMSEFTPAVNKVIKQLLASVFDEDEVAVIEGELEVSSAFSEQPWDHLIFTGSTEVGRHVMAAAAKNLVPVTLELGGKSPVIVDDQISLEMAAERICFGKSMNAGQTCVAPDYILVPEGKEQAFIDAYQKAFAKMYPSIADNPDYTAIINERQHQRLQAWRQDAADKGARLTEINPANESFDHGRKLPPCLIENISDDMQVAHEEIFGPLLLIVSYRTLDDAIQYINDRPRPLALYLFSHDRKTEKRVLEHTHAGGVSVNDTLMHLAQDDMPFGGVGPSGMGHYHGVEGFKSLSKAKAVHRRGRISGNSLIYPPYNKAFVEKLLKFKIR